MKKLPLSTAQHPVQCSQANGYASRPMYIKTVKLGSQMGNEGKTWSMGKAFKKKNNERNVADVNKKKNNEREVAVNKNKNCQII